MKAHKDGETTKWDKMEQGQQKQNEVRYGEFNKIERDDYDCD